jgi:hypothetical protein
MTEGRIIAIGDVHGCSAALAALVRAIDPTPLDTLVFLGDYIDRGPDSRGVVGQVIALAERCTVVPLLGNQRRCCSPPSKASPNCATGSSSGARRRWLPTATEAGRRHGLPPSSGKDTMNVIGLVRGRASTPCLRAGGIGPAPLYPMRQRNVSDFRPFSDFGPTRTIPEVPLA